jgi:DNA (cytosine-5)-methyltransferase 1
MVPPVTEEALAHRPGAGGRDEDWHTADIVVGGFPCQDISNAGERTGISGDSSSLWRWLCGAIRMVRPLYAIVENVAALLNRGMDTVCGDLAEIGYDAEWHCIPASSVGAPHERDRVWIVAHSAREQAHKQLLRPGQLGDELRRSMDSWKEAARSQDWPAGDDDATRLAEILRKASDAGIHGVVDGVSGKTHRLRGLGNAVIPQIPELIGRAILNAKAECDKP